MVDLEMLKNSMRLDLSLIDNEAQARNNQEEQKRQDQNDEIEMENLAATGAGNEPAPSSSMTERGVMSGYLFKTAQSLSTFQRKQFYKRYYELDMTTKRLKIYEKEGGSLKDTMICEVAYVVK